MLLADETPQCAASPARCLRVFREAGYATVDAWYPHGPAGFALIVSDRIGEGSVIVSQAEHAGAEWLHASIAWANHMPSYDDLVTLKAAAFGRRRWAYQVFAPAEHHVNLHNYALHLWGRVDGQPVLPNFGALGMV